MRVHELAKDLGVTNKLLLAKLRERGIEVKNHMTPLEDDHIIVMRAIIPLAIEEESRKEAEAQQKAEEERQKAEDMGRRAEEAKRKAEEEAGRKAEEDARRKAEAEKLAAEEAARKAAEPKPAAKPEPATPAAPEPAKKPISEPAPQAGAADTRIAKAAAAAPAAEKAKATAAVPPAPPAATPEKPAPIAGSETPETLPPSLQKGEAEVADKLLRVRGGITVRELAEMVGEKPNRIVAELMGMNVFANINAKLDYDVAAAIAEKRGFVVEHEKRGGETPSGGGVRSDDEPYQDKPEDLLPRAPVVTFLGHVDHGKTSLLDQIRNATVAKGESGGITQHIGAYTVEMSGKPITFLDTPGHAAFTAMRARGANLTDIAVIIIAADDGIMPQTKEAIAHAKAAEVAIMVAINKCDLPAANPDRVLQQLQGEGLAPEEWGGATICCKVSAMTGEGVPHLLEMILLQAEMLELTANPNKRATGFVVEAHLQPGMGPTATVLVTGGTLKIGDAILCGPHWGRVRALIDDHGRQVKSAPPSSPVKCLGLSGVPDAGAEFIVMPGDKRAKEIAAQRTMSIKTASLEAPRKASLDDLFTQLKTSAEAFGLSLILKTDAQGSVEAIIHALKDIKSEKVSLRFIHSGTGNITVNDILLASASNAVVLGFHVAKEAGVDAIAKREGVEIRLHQIIYELIDQVRDAMIGVLGPKMEEIKRGQAQVRQIFEIGKSGRIGGCLVLKGTINAKNRVRVKRKNEVLFEGAIHSLKHFQDDVAEVREAQECGIRVQNFADLAEGDIIEAYDIEEREQTL